MNNNVLLPDIKNYYVDNHGSIRRKDAKIKRNKYKQYENNAYEYGNGHLLNNCHYWIHKHNKDKSNKFVISRLTKRIMKHGYKKDKKR